MENYQKQQNKKVKSLVKKVVFGVLGFIALMILLSSIVIIGAGERGVLTNWGAVSDTIYEEGLHFKVPFMQGVKVIDVTTQKEESTGTEAASKDLQTVTTTVAINYHLEPTKVNKIYQTLRNDYSVRVIQPTIEEYVKKTTAEFTAEELITKRSEVKQRLSDGIKLALAENNIIVEDMFITNFSFSAQFDNAIEAKVTAEQEALRAKNDLERVKMEAEQRVAQAKAEAEAIKIQAEAITQQGGEDYVNLKAVEKWNGILPTQMIPNATLPFINLNK